LIVEFVILDLQSKITNHQSIMNRPHSTTFPTSRSLMPRRSATRI
jgi:hypothetical protein